ncbi:MAG: RNA polymerase sigma factor [Planctomycetota bacterium]
MSDVPGFVQRLRPLQPQLIALARRAADRPADAEDVLQSAIAAAFAVRASYEPARPFAAWIAGFVLATARNHNRRTRRRRTVPLDEHSLVEQLEQEQDYERLLEDPEAALDHVGDALFRALHGLRSRMREVFLLRSLFEFSYKDIAVLCGIPVGTVMSRLHRARASLRQALVRRGAAR